MPRITPSQAPPFFTFKAHPLERGTHSKLLQLLGFDATETIRSRKIISGIEKVLGIYVCGYEVLDDIPKPTHYVAVFTDLARNARNLGSTLKTMPDFYRNQFKLYGVDLVLVEK